MNPIQFYTGLSETLHMFSPGFADMHVAWIMFLKFISVTFSTLLTLSFSFLKFNESL